MTRWNRKWQGEGPFYHSLDITLQSPLPLFSNTLILIQYQFSIFPLSSPLLWQVLETRQFARWYQYCSLHAWLRQCALLVISTSMQLFHSPHHIFTLLNSYTYFFAKKERNFLEVSSHSRAGALTGDTVNWNWIKSNAGFWGEGTPEYPEKTSQCRAENQQTQPTCDPGSGNRTPVTL